MPPIDKPYKPIFSQNCGRVSFKKRTAAATSLSSRAWVHHKVPYFPLIPIILHYIRKYLGVNPERYSPKYNIPKIAPRPVFIIHGRYDNLVPAAQAKMLFKKAGEPKEIWLVPGAKHNKCAEVGGFEYKQRLADFFRQYL